VKDAKQKKGSYAAVIPTISVDSLPLVSGGEPPAPPPTPVSVDDLPKVSVTPAAPSAVKTPEKGETTASAGAEGAKLAGEGERDKPTSTTETTSAELTPRAPATGVPAEEAPKGGGEDDKLAAKEREEQGTPAKAEAAPKHEGGSLLRRATARESRSDAIAELEQKRREADASPQDPQALKAWAKAAYQARDSKEARRAGRAWAAHDGSPEPRIFLATVLESSGRRTEAKSVLDEYLAKHPDSAEVKRMRARLGGERKPTRR
jgi:hypothetical protein